jgi:mono/diheme cytochrome c family protein
MMLRVVSVALLWAAAAATAASQVIEISPTVVLPSMSGREIFEYYCTSCHGPEGRGNGPIAGELKTVPADLTRLAANNGGVFPVDRVRAFITHGRLDAAAHGSPEMPVWGPIFRSLDPSDEIVLARIDNIVVYLRNIQTN